MSLLEGPACRRDTNAPSGPVPDTRCHSKPSVITTLSRFVVCLHFYRLRFSSYVNLEVSHNLLSFLTLLFLLFTQFPHSTFLHCIYFAASCNSFSFTSLSSYLLQFTLYYVPSFTRLFYSFCSSLSTQFHPAVCFVLFKPSFRFISLCPVMQISNQITADFSLTFPRFSFYQFNIMSFPSPHPLISTHSAHYCAQSYCISLHFPFQFFPSLSLNLSVSVPC